MIYTCFKFSLFTPVLKEYSTLLLKAKIANPS